MLVKDYLKDVSLFSAINYKDDLPFDDELLDGLLLIEYGDKKLFSKLEGVTVDLVGMYINTLHSDNWLRLIELNAMYEDVKAGENHVVTETITTTENRANNRNELKKVSGFNSDELLVNDGADIVGDESLDGERIRTLTDKKISLNSLYNSLSLSQKHFIINRALQDTASFLASKIY